jgi:hypothetical protein
MRHLPGTVATGIALVLLVGCGGSGRLSKPQYERQVQAEAHSLVGASVMRRAGASDLLGAEQQGLNRVAAHLAALKPPKDAEADHRRLVAGLRGVAAIFGSLRAAGTDVERRRAAEQALARSRASEQVQAALDGLKRKGYDVGAFGGGS